MIRTSKKHNKQSAAALFIAIVVFLGSILPYLQPAYAQEVAPELTPTPFLTNSTSENIEVPEDLSTISPTPAAEAQTPPVESSSLSTLLSTITPAVKKTPQSARLKRGTKFSALARKSYQAHEKIRLGIEKDVENTVTLAMVSPDGKVLPVPHTEESAGELTTFVITPPQAFIPGRYQILITDSTGETFTQDFTWGVLAINTNKSIYAPNEKVYAMMGVLNEQGSTICDARLTLTITQPDGQNSILSTEQGDIKIHEDCKLKAYTPNPDYYTTFQSGTQGTYTLELSAETTNGSYVVQDRFEVRESVPFDIERSGPTRIYPPKSYDVEITVKANEDFSGYIEETTPFDFTIIKNETSPHDIEEVTRLSTSGKVLGTSTAIVGMPFDGETVVTTKFGTQYDADHLNDNLVVQGLKGHDGIDFALEEGTKVKSVDAGTVLHADVNPYGKTVIVEHSWGTTYYGHLSAITVQIGDTVTKGQEVGISGSTGNSTGPHLHFALSPHGTGVHNGYGGMVDPAPYLGIQDGTVLAAQDDLKTNVRVLKWKVDLKKGDTKSLKYSFKAPDISPEFYLLGPLTFKHINTSEVVFQEIRKWQIAADADVTIDSAAVLGTSRGMRNTVFISTLVGYHFFIDNDSDLSYLKTTDGGASWTGLTDIKASETILGFDVWYDKWTTGDTGTKIHIWYFGTGADDIIYESLDTANNDTQTSEVIAFNGTTAVAGRGVFVSGAKMRGGNLYVAFDIDAGAEKGVRRSTDGGSNWTIRYTTGTTDTIIEATVDQSLVFPGNEADNQDMWLLYHDASTNELTLKVHDDSANSTSESANIVTLAEKHHRRHRSIWLCGLNSA
ncbi:MAG: Glycyl-glycine endopeptidase LytM precursor [Microgenomates bacterium OLB23]|nr:MAG: Glycyl-glycine endopeptidase LytM precursor [Microgenomates bacterium OLB23]